MWHSLSECTEGPETPGRIASLQYQKAGWCLKFEIDAPEVLLGLFASMCFILRIVRRHVLKFLRMLRCGSSQYYMVAASLTSPSARNGKRLGRAPSRMLPAYPDNQYFFDIFLPSLNTSTVLLFEMHMKCMHRMRAQHACVRNSPADGSSSK